MNTTVTDTDKEPAYELWVELSTRITTRRLHYRSGEEEAAAASIYGLFGKCRGLMLAHPGAEAFQELALCLLNETLRSHTARWHGWMTKDAEERDKDGKAVLKFRDEWVRRQFRKELRALQPRLLGFLKAFEALKEAGMPEDWWTRPNDDQLKELRDQLHEETSIKLGAALSPGITCELSCEGGERTELEGICKEINEAEHHEIRRRRGGAKEEPIQDATGLAFSGGGIRSATFCLGITQVLAQRGLLGQFDYLSTVSGGGYFGSFLSRELGTGDCVTDHAIDSKEEAEERIKDTFTAQEGQSEPRGLRHLRNRSRYLVDDGFLNKGIEIVLVAAGILFNLLIVLPLPLLAVVAVFGLDQIRLFGEYDWLQDSWIPPIEAPISQAFYSLCGLIAIFLALYPPLKKRALDSSRQKKPSRGLEHWWAAFRCLSVLSVAVFLLWLIPSGFRMYDWLTSGDFLPWLSYLQEQMEVVMTTVGVALTAILGTVATKLKNGGAVGFLMKSLAIFSGPLLFLLVFFGVGQRIMCFSDPGSTAGPEWHWAWVLGVAFAVMAWAWLCVDVNTYSPHGYYRNRLCECYLPSWKAEQSKRGKEDKKVGRQLLSGLNATTGAPYHLINTTVNLPSSEELELRGRGGDFYLLSKHFCGSPICGYRPTKELEEVDPHFDLGTAMAISGAAASSNMGWQTKNSFRLLMTLANIRLGYWLRSPKRMAILREKKAGKKSDGNSEVKKLSVGGPGPLMLFREMFAQQMDEDRSFLNLSDGGHIENLAAYELLRRRCKFIVCVDAGMDSGMECSDLLRLERYAAIDLGIQMHYDLSDLMLQSSGYSRAYGALVKVDYSPPGTDAERRKRMESDGEEPEWGWMLYIKLGMIGYGPGYVLDYKREHPDFPHQSTGDQVYDEAQFEAYRALGESAAESFLNEELVESTETKIDMKEWFTALATNLLPDNDEAFPG